MKIDLKSLGYRLRKARETKKLTREHLADYIDVHFRTLAKWENGQSDPPLGKIIKAAEILETPLADLLDLNQTHVKDSFNNNQQDGDTCILNSGTIYFDKEVMNEFHKRFSFMESLILLLQGEKTILLRIIEDMPRN